MHPPLASHQRSTTPDCSVDPRLLTPDLVAHAYGYDQLWKRGWQGQGMTVNLVELEGFDPLDIQNYLACVQFHGHLRTVNVGTPPRLVSGFGESSLDIEMVAGLAPAINIVVYQTALDKHFTADDFWTRFNDQLTQMVNENTKTIHPSVVSISWGGPEDGLTPGVMKAIRTNLQLLTQAEHMTVFVASGDCGAYDGTEYKVLSVDYPASDPSAIAVGGTLLGINTQGNRASEIAWSDDTNPFYCSNLWGSGGGLSKVFQQPGWQNGNGVKNHYSTGYRQVPDISAVALNLLNYVQSGWGSTGGTSAATPIWATGLSLVNQGLIAKHSMFVAGTGLFYAVAERSGSRSPFYNIISGNNLYDPATPGWDFASGLGTPNLADFFAVLDANIQSAA